LDKGRKHVADLVNARDCDMVGLHGECGMWREVGNYSVDVSVVDGFEEAGG
jgi:hypothetical protein